MNENNDISIIDLCRNVLKQWKIIAITLVFGLIIGVILNVISYTTGKMNITYTISASVSVNAKTLNSDSYIDEYKTGSPSKDEMTITESLITPAMYIATSSTVLNNVIDKCELKSISASTLKSKITVTQYEESQILIITLNWASGEEGIQILSTLVDTMPDIMKSSLDIGSVSYVDEPHIVGQSGGSFDKNKFILAVFGGFILGFAYTVIKYFIHPTLLNTEDVKKNIGLDIIGAIPSDIRYYKNNLYLTHSTDDSRAIAVQENYAAAASILISRLEEMNGKIFYITSAGKDEGKTESAINLAVQIASFDKKVLLIDGNIRSPRIGRILEGYITKEKYLNELFKQGGDARDCVNKVTDHLDAIPAKLEDENIYLDSCILTSIRDISSDYDYVIIDTAPVGDVADAVRLNDIADAAVFVVRYDKTWGDLVKNNISKLKKTGIPIIGGIANCFTDTKK